MGLEKLLSEQHEEKQIKKKEAKENHSTLDKNSTKTADLAKRLDAIEKFLGLN